MLHVPSYLAACAGLLPGASAAAGIEPRGYTEN